MSEGFIAVLNFDTLAELRREIEERMLEKGVTKSDLGEFCPAFLLKPSTLTQWNTSEIVPATIAEIAYLAGRLQMKFEITGIRIL
jgi:hypothetical protein